MKTKLLALVVAVAAATGGLVVPGYTLLVVVAIVAVHALIGIPRSKSKGLNPLNDLPNSFRLLLAGAGGSIVLNGSSFLLPSAGILLIAAGLLLNDESQRRILDSVSRGKRGGAVVLMGIDGSGKSTHAMALVDWFNKRGYASTLVPFHRYLFLNALPRGPGADLSAAGVPRGGNPIRPVVSYIDNLLSFIMTCFGKGLQGRVVIYDRFIWSTYVKYRALGYPVRPLRALYLLPRPRVAAMLDIPVERSLGVINRREAHIKYTETVLAAERVEYLALAKNRGYPILDSTGAFGEVESQIELILGRAFPAIEAGSK